MSQRVLIPTNLFYHWADPAPPDFPEPNTGDIYLNVLSQMIRVFYEGEWHDSGANVSAGYLTSSDADQLYVQIPDFSVSTAAPPPAGPPAGGGVNSVWIQY